PGPAVQRVELLGGQVANGGEELLEAPLVLPGRGQVYVLVCPAQRGLAGRLAHDGHSHPAKQLDLDPTCCRERGDAADLLDRVSERLVVDGHRRPAWSWARLAPQAPTLLR